VARREITAGEKRYYVIEIPDQELTVFVPVRRAEEAGLRPALSRNNLPQVLDLLRSEPQTLPEDYKERQALMLEELQTGRVMRLAQLVRDLTWHGKRLHLTKKDADYLRQGQDLLAAEMALALDDDITKVNELISTTMTTAVVGRTEERPRVAVDDRLEPGGMATDPTSIA
jgi:CarD family transcriptional regulator